MFERGNMTNIKYCVCILSVIDMYNMTLYILTLYIYRSNSKNINVCKLVQKKLYEDRKYA